jgi:hypothetical protein
MTDLTLEALRAELAPITRRLAAIEPAAAGIPFIQRGIETLRHEIRQIKFAINDVAAIQMTSGEAEALHDDVDKTMNKQNELEARIVTLERLIKELQGNP